jgi:hypothetical protein
MSYIRALLEPFYQRLIGQMLLITCRIECKEKKSTKKTVTMVKKKKKKIYEQREASSI